MTELQIIHAILQAPAACPPAAEGDTVTVARLKALCAHYNTLLRRVALDDEILTEAADRLDGLVGYFELVDRCRDAVRGAS